MSNAMLIHNFIESAVDIILNFKCHFRQFHLESCSHFDKNNSQHAEITMFTIIKIKMTSGQKVRIR